ncbi:FAD:protein FMN transferase [Paramesorhizobium deserti]|uniref:FAD:protein FMN transferase n=1 Tax=Paramesorhizobium deserti TaxID=1494590 RepID=UPI0009E9F451|nr:FAD:protein FMN transferase [Paramesorhizobium deserti]
MHPRLSRRRMIKISAAAAGLALLPARLQAAVPTAVQWRGRALGATASLTLNHPDPAEAHRLIERIEAEIRRLERIFSLYLPDSELAVLNRDCAIDSPSRELVALLDACRNYREITGGVFDPTVQPLWEAYRQYFASGTSEGSLERCVAVALSNVGLDGVMADRNRIAFAKPGMGLTLNGVAQGAITDRIIDMIKAAGLTSCLADLGECRALGTAADGSGWRVGIDNPLNSGEVAKILEITDRAVATSSPLGFRFEESGRHNHLLDPLSGLSARRHASVTVVARCAEEADALSTAFSLMEPEQAREVVQKMRKIDVFFIDFDGKITELRTENL